MTDPENVFADSEAFVLLLAGMLLGLGAGLQSGCQSAPEPRDLAQKQRSKPTKAKFNVAPANPITSDVIVVGAGQDFVHVEGEKIVELNGGSVPEHQKKDGESSLEILPLREAIDRKIREAKAADQTPQLRIEAAAQLGYRTLAEIAFTAGQTDVLEATYRYQLAVTPPGASDATRRVDVVAPKLKLDENGNPAPPDKDALNLTVGVGSRGFRIAAKDRILAPQGRCPKVGPTICLRDQNVDVEEVFERARIAAAGGSGGRARKRLAEAIGAYDFAGLYNTLVRLKNKNPKATQINVAADADIPVELVVRVIELAERRLPRDSYDDPAALRRALDENKSTDALFPRAIFAVVK